MTFSGLVKPYISMLKSLVSNADVAYFVEIENEIENKINLS